MRKRDACCTAGARHVLTSREEGGRCFGDPEVEGHTTGCTPSWGCVHKSGDQVAALPVSWPPYAGT